MIVKNNTSIFTTRITRNVFIFSSLFFWFYPFLHARTSAENFSISFLLIGISILLCLIQNKFNHKIIFLFFAGIFLGGAFISRYQIGIMILFFFIWSYIYKKFSLKELILIASGIILTILLEIIINSWGYNNNNYFPKSTLVYSNYFPYLNYVNYENFCLVHFKINPLYFATRKFPLKFNFLPTSQPGCQGSGNGPELC